jgi:hypothetical protein
MIKFLRTPNAIRIEYSNGKYNDSLFSKTTSVDVVGNSIVISNGFDPTPVNITVPYSDVISPQTANIAQLRNILQGWVNEGQSKLKTNIIEIPNAVQQEPTTNRLQARNGELYWNGNVLLATPTQGPVIGNNSRTIFEYLGSNTSITLPFFDRTVIVDGLNITGAATILLPATSVFTNRKISNYIRLICTNDLSGGNLTLIGNGGVIRNNFDGGFTNLLILNISRGDVFDIFLDQDPSLGLQWIIYKVRTLATV